MATGDVASFLCSSPLTCPHLRQWACDSRRILLASFSSGERATAWAVNSGVVPMLCIADTSYALCHAHPRLADIVYHSLSSNIDVDAVRVLRDPPTTPT